MQTDIFLLNLQKIQIAHPMKSPIRRFLSKFKYIIALAIFAVFILFIGEHSWVNRIQRKREISELNKKIAAEREKFEADSIAMHAIEHDIDAVRKIARERYFMKNSGEDVFMISDDEEEE